MADYVNITNAALDGDSPGTQTLFEALRDNPIAISEGADGAPRIQLGAIANDAIVNANILDGTITPDKLYPATAGTFLEAESLSAKTSTSKTYAKIKEIQLLRGGTYRISFTFEISSGYSYARIYKNGVAVGVERTYSGAGITYTEDISGFSTSDLVQIYVKTRSSVAISTFLIKTSLAFCAQVTLD